MLGKLTPTGLAVVLSVGLLSVVVLESVALFMGHNGLMFTTAMVIIGAVLGVPVGLLLKK